MKKSGRILPVKMRKIMMMLLITLVFMDATFEASASHLVGGQITYTWVSGSTYRLKYVLYRDCSGIAAPTSVVLVANPGNLSFTLPRTGFSDASLLCPGQTSVCNGGTAPGIEEHIYEANVTLATNTLYTLSVSQSARTAAITTLTNASNQAMYLTAILNTTYAGNSSPQFLNRPIAQFCTSQPSSISPNGSDPNGDVIVYSLTNALQGAGQSVTYAAGFSGTNPLSSSTPITINPNTGQLSFTPTAVQVAVVTIKAEEFRGGIKIGEVNRDVMIKMVNCGANTPPVIGALPNVIVPVGNSYCVPVNANDVSTQTITLSAVSAIIPPATFIINSAGAGVTNGTFCFSPTAANRGNTYTVTINAQDNFCPTPGTSSRSFNITVPAACNVAVSATVTPSACGLSNGTATASLTNGTGPFVYSWTGPNGFTAITQSISGLSPGSYCVNISDAYNCAGSTCVIVAGGTPFPLTASIVNTVCGTNNGSITITPVGGVAPYTYQLNNGMVQNSNSFSDLGVGSYTVTVNDHAGCTKTQTFSVNADADLTPPTALCQSPTVILNGLGDGMLTASMVDNGSFDNCSIASYSLSKTSFNCSDVGMQPVTLTVTDVSGNSSSCTTTVTVVDNTPPYYVDCTNTTLELDANGTAALTAAQIADLDEIYEHEACGVLSVVLSKTNFDCSNLGPNPVTLTVTDVNGNVSSCTSTVTIVDNTAPVISCTAGIVVCGAQTVDYTAPTATDNCTATVTQTSGLPSGSLFPVGTTVNTFIAADASGNSVTCSFNVVVNPVPDVDPVANQTVCNNVPATAINFTGSVSGTTFNWTNDNSSVGLSANGTGSISSFTAVNTGNAPATANIIVTPVTASCTGTPINFTITINPTPTITCPGNQTANNIAGTCSSNVTYSSAVTGVPEPVVTYNFSGATSGNGNGNGSGSPFNAGITTVTLTATNNCAVSNCSFTVTVVDVEAPVITCPSDLTVNCQDNNSSATTGVATATDNCSAVTITQTQTSTQTATGSGHYNYLISRTWTATDESGNFSTCVQTITVRDITAPMITCPVSVTLNCQEDNSSTSTGVATGTDQCSSVAITQSQTSTQTLTGSGHYNYVISRTWIATDESGNFSTCVQTITVRDITAPVITCPVSVTLNCQDNNSSATTGVATATDNCSAATITQSQISTQTATGSGHYNYVISRTWIATDESGNFSTCVQTITVRDITAPVITCPVSVTLNCQDNNSSATTGVATATDNCSAVTITQSQISTQTATGSGHYNYVISRTWTATDESGNFSTCVQTITVRDITAPVITCPVSVTLNCQDNNLSGSTGVATGTDNCSPVTISQSQMTTQTPTGSGQYNYTITRTWKATDESGNASTCVQTITVRDNTAPVITCPANVTLNCQDNALPASTGTATATDNCSAVTISQTQTTTQATSGIGLYNYVITRTWKATDLTGNMSTCVQTITVRDNTAPTINCPVNVTLNCQANNTSASTGNATGTDICSPVTISQSQTTTQTTSGYGLYNYVISRTWKATDVTGNFSTCVQIITVRDVTPPVISCITNQVKLTNAGLCTYQAQGNEFNPTATDNCAIPTLTYVLSGATTGSGNSTLAGVNFQKGITTVTWVAKDASNNQSSCTFTVVVNDDQNATDYIIYATTLANFGFSNHINGDVGVTASNGIATFGLGTVLDPHLVKSKYIFALFNNNVSNRVYSAATGGPNPAFQFYSGSTTGLANYIVTANSTLAGNYKNLTIRSGVTVTLQGNNFGTIIIEQGAKVTFTATVINMEQLFVANGPCSVYTFVNFANPASVRVKQQVTVLQNCRVNVGGPKVTFYLGDKDTDEEYFTVLGGNTQITANIMIPNGLLSVSGVFGNDIMTGWYIVERLESLGYDVTWNKYSCNSGGSSFGKTTELPIAVNIGQTKVAESVNTIPTKDAVFTVNVSPNPSPYEFNIQVTSKSSEPITIRIFDMSGKVRSVQTLYSKFNGIKTGANLPQGLYMAEVTQGSNKQIVKLVKLN